MAEEKKQTEKRLKQKSKVFSNGVHHGNEQK